MSAKKQSKWPYVVGSAISGFLEVLLFHPVDTIVKRQMNAENHIFIIKNLYNGVLYGLSYKVLQRIYKFGLLSILRILLRDKIGSRDISNATAGSIVGVGEVFLLPLDIFKIRSQCNYSNNNIFVNKYDGLLITMMRNIPGSFVLYGANILMYKYVYNVTGPSQARRYQRMLAAVLTGAAIMIVTQPFDVIKTRIQANKHKNVGIISTAKLIWKNQGIYGYCSGLSLKLILIPFKLIWSFTVARYIIAKLQRIDHKMQTERLRKEYAKYKEYRKKLNESRQKLLMDVVYNDDVANIILKYVEAMEDENALLDPKFNHFGGEYFNDCAVIARCYAVNLHLVREYIQEYKLAVKPFI